MGTDHTEAGPTEAGPTGAELATPEPAAAARRPLRRRVLVGLAVAWALLAVGFGAWELYRVTRDPSRRRGPAATISGTECGLGRPPLSLLSIDGGTGQLRWSRLIGAADTDVRTVAVAGDSVAVVADRYRQDEWDPVGITTQGLATADGSHRWCGQRDLLPIGDQLYTGAPGAWELVDPTTGTSTGPADAEELRVAIAEHRPALEVRSDDPQWDRHEQILTAYTVETGDVVWTRTLPIFGETFVVGDQVILKTWKDDKIRSLDPATGSEQWAVPHDHPGRTNGYPNPGYLLDVAVDPATGDLFVLMESLAPHRD